MDEVFYEVYAEWANGFIWTKEFAQMTTKDFERFEKREKEKIKGWDIGSPEIPY